MCFKAWNINFLQSILVEDAEDLINIGLIDEAFDDS
jgi:hypothetical protein